VVGFDFKMQVNINLGSSKTAVLYRKDNQNTTQDREIQGSQGPKGTVDHKSHDPCFYRKYIGGMTFVTHYSVQVPS